MENRYSKIKQQFGVIVAESNYTAADGADLTFQQMRKFTKDKNNYGDLDIIVNMLPGEIGNTVMKNICKYGIRIVDISLSTANSDNQNEYVKIYSHYACDLKLGIETKINIA